SVIEGVRLQVRYERLAISGRVLDPQGRARPDVRVVAAVQQPGQEAAFDYWQDLPLDTTAADGSFTLSGLLSRVYTLQARGEDGSTEVARNLQAGQRGVVVTLRAAGGVEGQLIGFAHPAQISAVRLEAAHTPPVAAAANGNRFQIRPLQPGTWRV